MGKCTAFFGIPYAAPPLGEHGRFRPPQPTVNWEGTRDASKDNHAICPQPADLNMPLRGVQRLEEWALGYNSNYTNEDCLFINVQTPSLSGSAPVLLYIHGGTNLVGSGNGFNASALCEDGVLFVSFNYRLGVLGVLSLQVRLPNCQPARSTLLYV